MNTNFKHARLAEQIKENVSIILQRKVKDPRIQESGIITVSELKLTNDLSLAKVYITELNGNNITEIVKLLNKMSGFLRSELASMVKMRSVPELRFFKDDVAESSAKMDRLFDEIRKSDLSSQNSSSESLEHTKPPKD